VSVLWTLLLPLSLSQGEVNDQREGGGRKERRKKKREKDVRAQG